jgi:ribosome-associated heat shock protein Hsp15
MREVDDAADRLRIDRWLWCARLFKTRSQAGQSVRSGHVRLNGERVKPAHTVKVGDSLHIARDETAERDIVITAIPWRRGPAPEALRCYAETPESVERCRIAAEERSVAVVLGPPTEGRPDKRTRRLLLRARQRGDVNR